MGPATTTIESGASVATLINFFTVTPENQQRLVELLVEATDEVISHRPGFVSANIHASQYSTRVVNYAQWSSVEDFRAMLEDPVAAPHLRAAGALATFEPHLYDVVSVHHA